MRREFEMTNEREGEIDQEVEMPVMSETGTTSGLILEPSQATEIDHRVDHIVRTEMKRVMMRFVVPAFLILAVGLIVSLGLLIKVFNDRTRDAYCVRVESRDQLRNTFDGVARLFGGDQAEGQIKVFLDASYPALPPKHCSTIETG